jgi:hypothetical protein
VLDRDTYDSLQALFASRRRGQRPTDQFLLTGVLACSDCGKTMNGGRTYKSPDGTRPRLYKCPPLTGGCSRSILAEPVEELVGQKMVELLTDPKYAAQIAEEQAELTEVRKAKQAKVDAIEDELVALEVKRANSEIIQAAYDAAKRVWDRKLLEAVAERDAVPPAASVKAEAAAGARGRANAVRLREATLMWQEASPDEKRALMRRYRLRPVVKAKPPSGRGADPRDRVRFA